MQETYIKKDSFEDKTFVNQIDFDFLNKIESLRKKNESLIGAYFSFGKSYIKGLILKRFLNK